MLIDDDMIIKAINRCAKKISDLTKGKLMFKEYIILPYYGYVILRFDLAQIDYDLDDLDYYETLMYKNGPDEFLFDFMGSVYKKIGLDLDELPDLLMISKNKYSDIELSVNNNVSLLKMGEYLLKLCDLDDKMDVWEIQREDDEIVILILGNENGMIKEVNIDSYHIYAIEVNRDECEGLMKAAIKAKRDNISIARVLLMAKG